MPDPVEATNTITPGQEAAPEAANAAPEVGLQVTPKADETTPELMYEINYKGQAEKLPVSKLIDYAQQGRDYSEKMGRLNAEIEARAKELTDAAIERFYNQPTPANPPAPDPNATPEELDEFTKLQKDVESLKREKLESAEKAEFEKAVEKERVSLNDQLVKAKDKFPLMNERNVLAVLRSNPQANIMDLARYEHDMEKERRDAWEKNFLEEAKKRGKRGAEGAGGTVPAITEKKLVLGKNTQEAAMEMLSRQY